MNGWDGMVIIGQRSSKSTFSANKEIDLLFTESLKGWGGGSKGGVPR